MRINRYAVSILVAALLAPAALALALLPGTGATARVALLLAALAVVWGAADARRLRELGDRARA